MISNRWRWIAAAGVMLLCGMASAKPADIVRAEVEILPSAAPEAELRRNVSVASKSETLNRWLMIRVEYTVARSKNAAPEYRERNGKRYLVHYGYLDDVDLEVRVLFDTGFKVNGEAVCGLFTGSVRLTAIRRDGKKHVALMFVPGKLLDRYSQSVDGAIRRLGRGDFRVEAVFGASGRELIRAYGNISGRDAFDKAIRNVPDNLRIVGGVLPRSRTPWALLNDDNFDLEKSLFVPERD